MNAETISVENQFAKRAVDARIGHIIKLAIMAVGGQGGAVLTNWIESLARAQGYACQATSVAGVAQRTGSTIYYVEMAPKADGQPVFSLAPAAGDVDILIASELMEAGRAIMRGFVTPDKTTLIASTHRAFAMSEKMTPGDGIAKESEVLAAAEIAANRLICLNMEVLAVANGSVISATLFGALAGSGCLPFARTAFEEAIRRGGKGVDASLRAFSAAFDACIDGTPNQLTTTTVASKIVATGSKQQLEQWQKLESSLATLPQPSQSMAFAGLRKVTEFMDLAYGREYLERLQLVAALDASDHDFALTTQAAKYLAKAMAYDDIIHVADRKTRAARKTRISSEMGAGNQNVVQLTEYFHPRAEEIVGMMPARMGRRTQKNPRSMDRIDRWFGKGRRLRSDRILPFAVLYVLGGLKRYRRRTWRHEVEMQHLDNWLTLALDQSKIDYGIGVEILRCHRLIKGYSHTHARGLSKFERVMQCLEFLNGRDDAAIWIKRLREAALQDEEGKALDGAIKTVKSFAHTNA